jgi:cell division septation protein DedD
VYVDTKGVPGRVELRLGTIAAASPAPMSSLVSADGWAVYGIDSKRDVERLTPSGNWSHPSGLTPRMILPQPDGSLVLLNDAGNRSVLRRLHPPEARVTDTTSVPKASLAVNTSLGDRIYFATDSGLAGVRVRDLARTPTIRVRGEIRDAVTTPSGDRVFVAIAGQREIVVIDRYEERITSSIHAGGLPIALRMDPDGRYLLVRYDGADSAAVVSVAESRVVRVVATQWRDDLPLVAPDGALLTLEGSDALDVDPVAGKTRHRYTGGAGDFWALIRWNGFRPRAKGLDTPVSFEEDSTDAASRGAADSARARAAVAAATAPIDVSRSAIAPPAPGAATSPQTDAKGKSNGWTLSFAAMLDEARAKTLALTIHVDAHPVHVVEGKRDGIAIWRVVSGPFTTRDDAERAGRRTGLPYWVYEDTP